MDGDEEKKPHQGMSWLVKGGIIIFAIIAIIMVGTTINARQKNSENATTPPTPSPTVVTLPALNDRVTSMQASLDSLSGRVANLDTRLTGLGTPNVTQADITRLRGSLGNLTVRIDGVAFSLASLNATVANISQGNSTNSTNLSDIEDNISDIKDALIDLDTRLDALEDADNGTKPGDVTPTGWTPAVYISSGLSAEIISGESLQIEDADSYLIGISIDNERNETVNDVTVTMDLAPDDLTTVSPDTTFWGRTKPYTWTTALYGGTSSCSLIEGVSGKFNVPSTLEEPFTIQVRFKLVYGN